MFYFNRPWMICYQISLCLKKLQRSFLICGKSEKRKKKMSQKLILTFIFNFWCGRLESLKLGFVDNHYAFLRFGYFLVIFLHFFFLHFIQNNMLTTTWNYMIKIRELTKYNDVLVEACRSKSKVLGLPIKKIICYEVL